MISMDRGEDILEEIGIGQMKCCAHRMKLYIWDGFCPSCGDGLAFAIAETITQAKTLVRAEHGSEPYIWGNVTIHDIEPVARCVMGGD